MISLANEQIKSLIISLDEREHPNRKKHTLEYNLEPISASGNFHSTNFTIPVCKLRSCTINTRSL